MIIIGVTSTYPARSRPHRPPRSTFTSAPAGISAAACRRAATPCTARSWSVGAAAPAAPSLQQRWGGGWSTGDLAGAGQKASKAASARPHPALGEPLFCIPPLQLPDKELGCLGGGQRNPGASSVGLLSLCELSTSADSQL